MRRSPSCAGACSHLVVMAALLLSAACAPADEGELDSPRTDGSQAGADASRPGGHAAGDGAAPDSLVVVVRVDSVNRAMLPGDWHGLLHPRFDGQFVMPDPNVSPEARAFMEGVLLAESARTGVADAGFDWLRRLDAVVLAYVEDVEDGIAAFRRGEAVVIALPSRMAGPLLAESWVVQAVMSSGAHPRWPPEESGDSTVAEEPARLPPQWLTTWRAEVRGTGLAGG